MILCLFFLLQFIYVCEFGIITHFYYLSIFKILYGFTHSFVFVIDKVIVKNHELVHKGRREEEYSFFRSGVMLILYSKDTSQFWIERMVFFFFFCIVNIIELFVHNRCTKCNKQKYVQSHSKQWKTF